MADPRPLSLKQRVLNAGGWTAGGHGLSQAIRLASNLVMTRLLVPEMFGVMAIATMTVTLLGMLSDIGLQQSIVRSQRGDDPAFLNTAWTIQIIRGAVLWLAALLVSIALHAANLAGLLPPESVYASPVLPLVIAVTSFSAVILGFQSTRVAIAYRGLQQKRLVQMELIGHLGGLVVCIVVGVATRSIWALVASWLVGILVITTLSHTWLDGQPNRLRWEKQALREIIGFGKWVFMSSAIFVFAANGDRLLLGGLADAHVLGLYAIAALIVGAVEGVMQKLFVTISLPVLSETARDRPERLRDVYYKLRVPADLFLLFLAGLLFAAGQLIVDLLYDARYSAAGGMLQVLSLSLFTVRYAIAQNIYIAMGAPQYLAVLSAVRFTALYALVPALYHFGGIRAAIWGIALHALATVPLVYAFNARFGINDLRRELAVLIALPVGYLCGSALNLLRGW